jgi:hypothetical protein
MLTPLKGPIQPLTGEKEAEVEHEQVSLDRRLGGNLRLQYNGPDARLD